MIGGFGYRLADLQLTPDQALAEPISRTLRTEDLPAQRGSIVDRLGRPLAYSRPAPTIVADPRLISTEQVPYVVGQLASFLDTDPEVMARRLTSDSRFVYLERQVDPEIGDAVMALFANKTDDALLTACELIRQLEEYNNRRKTEFQKPISIGIGIHFGPLMLGTLGNEERMEGTVISESVNLASRLES
ncbi:MAG: hypothetical protein EBY49_11755, partial [Actinobacteria bacterium]|nr:hypothetical protein [Actinomycetota bacterium]